MSDLTSNLNSRANQNYEDSEESDPVLESMELERQVQQYLRKFKTFLN